MEYEKIAPLMGSWAPYFREFIESEAFDDIFRELKSRKQRKINTAPESKNLFRTFLETDPSNLKVILCGICPYHTFIQEGKDKFPVADGLMMSSSKTHEKYGIQPSLCHLYGAMETEYSNGLDTEMIQTGDLSYLAKQGVLLTNISLTVQEGKPLSDNILWTLFNKYFWEEVINKYFKGLIIVFMGSEAHKSALYLNPMLHYHFNLSHPTSASYKGETWDSEGIFKKIDKILWDNNKQKIQWYQRRGDETVPF